MAVAHDVLEHFPKDDSTTGELMAQGAMVHIRGSEYFRAKGRRDTSVAAQGAGEIAALLEKVRTGEWVSILPAGARYCQPIESHLSELITEIESNMQSEFERDMTIEEDELVRYWVSVGFQRALKRYKGTDRGELLDAFTRIEDEADRVLKRAEEGDTLTVNLVWRNNVADLRLTVSQ